MVLEVACKCLEIKDLEKEFQTGAQNAKTIIKTYLDEGKKNERSYFRKP
jgi:hypothetical protein